MQRKSSTQCSMISGKHRHRGSENRLFLFAIKRGSIRNGDHISSSVRCSVQDGYYVGGASLTCSLVNTSVYSTSICLLSKFANRLSRPISISNSRNGFRATPTMTTIKPNAEIAEDVNAMYMRTSGHIGPFTWRVVTNCKTQPASVT